MKSFISVLGLAMSASAFSVEGYKDIYLDKQEDIVVHGLMCGADLNNLNKLRPSNVFTNTPHVERGTYYYKSAFGEYSLTFNTTENPNIMVRGLLASGKTDKSGMVKELCLVRDVEGLPESLRKYLTKKIIKADDKNWQETMKNYELVAGKPAFGKGQY